MQQTGSGSRKGATAEREWQQKGSGSRRGAAAEREWQQKGSGSRKGVAAVEVAHSHACDVYLDAMPQLHQVLANSNQPLDVFWEEHVILLLCIVY